MKPPTASTESNSAAGDSPTIKEFLAKKFNLFPEALLIADMILERNLDKLVKNMVSLLRRMTGVVLIDDV